MKRTVALTTLIGAAAVAAPAFADGGYYGGALGARAAGRAGAFVARADDPTALFYNPAGIAKLGTTVIQIGDRLSHNAYSFTRAPTLDWGNATGDVAPTVSFDQVKNGTPWQPLQPLLAVASNLGLRDWGFAVALFSAPGASRAAFPINGGQRYMMVSREPVILNYTATVAWKRGDRFGFGATVAWIHVPQLRYALVIDGTTFPGTAHPVSTPLAVLATTSGSDPFTLNATLGGWFRPAPFLELGLAGQVVPTNIEAKGRLDATLLPTPQDPNMRTVVLSRNEVPANDVTVVLPLPLMVRAGARYRHLSGGRERFDVELDVEYETWSRVESFALETHGLVAAINDAQVNLGRITVAKHWRDTVAVKLGGDFAVIPERWTLRAGAFYETAVAAAAYANVDFPGGRMFGGSLGTSLSFGPWEVALAYQLRRMADVNVAESEGRVYQQVPASTCTPPYDDPNACNPHYPGQPSPTVNAGHYAASSHYFVLAVLYRYGS